MKAVFLHQMPRSGEYPERTYAPTLECDWVLFEPDVAESWVGAFGRGSFGCREAVRVGRTSVFLILASGEPYLVDCESGALAFGPSGHDIRTALHVPERDLVIAADLQGLFAFAASGLLWESPVVAIDGVDLLDATSEEVLGTLHTEDGHEPFTLELDGWRLHSGGVESGPGER